MILDKIQTSFPPMLKLSSIEICATSNVNRAWQIASQRLPFESGINSGIRKRCSTCFLQRAIIKIRPIFFSESRWWWKARSESRRVPPYFLQFWITYRNSSRLRFARFVCILHASRVFDVDTALFHKGTTWNVVVNAFIAWWSSVAWFNGRQNFEFDNFNFSIF